MIMIIPNKQPTDCHFCDGYMVKKIEIIVIVFSYNFRKKNKMIRQLSK